MTQTLQMITYSDGTTSASLPTSAERAAMITSVGGWIYLGGYDHPLPQGLTHVRGWLDLRGYGHPLPQGLTHVGGGINLGDYGHPLPQGLTHVGGGINLGDYGHPLPQGLTHVGGWLYLGGYGHPLPQGLTHVGGGINLRGYDHPLPQGLTHVGGGIDLRGYGHPLPTGLAHVGGWLDLRDYGHPLPQGLASGLPIPVIPQIDARILQTIASGGGRLRMDAWHTCQTTHCRAGWAVHLAGEAGYALEKRLGSAAAGALIYQASRPGMMFPDFYASNDAALADIKACAAQQELTQ